jgi:putative glutamine amidotransferase
MKRPVILTTCDTDHAKRIYFLRQPYLRAIEDAGGNILVVPPHAHDDIAELINIADALFMTGGDDIDAKHFGEETEPHYSGTIDEPRYQLQVKLLPAALKKNIPILGVCHGMQMLNVFFGGTLHQDIAHELSGALQHQYKHIDPNRAAIAHEVSVTSGSKLAAICSRDKLSVNSLHHQGIDRLGDGLVKTASAPDGLIEAVEKPEHRFLIGVQWHPEELNDEPSRALFAAFINAAKG